MFGNFIFGIHFDVLIFRSFLRLSERHAANLRPDLKSIKINVNTIDMQIDVFYSSILNFSQFPAVFSLHAKCMNSDTKKALTTGTGRLKYAQ